MPNEIFNILNDRAQAAKFKAVQNNNLEFYDKELWPSKSIESQLGYWESSFASLLLVQVPCTTPEDARAYAKNAELYLDASLVRREAKGTVIDGYLILALTEFNNDFINFISEIERDTRFVRKHVVYKNSEGWHRYERITSIGLGSELSKVKNSNFEPDDDSSELLEKLSELGSKTLAELHGKEWNLNE